MKKNEKMALALFAGATLAAGIIYLFTSKRGGTIRKNVLIKGRQIVDELQDEQRDSLDR